MKDIGTALRAGDPLLDDPGLSPAEIDAMRRTIVQAATQSAVSPSWFPPLLAVAATAAALTIAVVGARRHDGGVATQDVSVDSNPASRAAEGAGGRRQLQFAMPGGTRVIWVFDPEFNP